MALKTIHAVVLAIVIVVVAGVAIALINGGGPSDDNFDVKTSIVKDGDASKMVIECNKDIFNNVTSNNVKILITGLDSYVHSEWFDMDTFAADCDATGHFDEQYGIMISSDAYEMTGDNINVDQDGKKKVSITFEAPASEYCLYQLLFGENTLDLDIDDAYLEEYVVPSGTMIVPSIEITKGIYENQTDPSIEVTIKDGSFVDGISPEYVVLDGGFYGLTISSIEKVSDDKIIINTNGTVPRCYGISGIIIVFPEAYSGPSWYTEDRLTASTVIDYNSVILDTFDVYLDADYNLVIPVYFSQSYYDRMTQGELTLCDFDSTAEYDIAMGDVTKIGDETFTGYLGYLLVPVTILFLDDFDNIMLCSDGVQITDLTTYSDSVIATVYDVSEDYKRCKVSVMPVMMYFASDITADSFVFPDGIKVESFKLDKEAGIAEFELSANEVPEVQRYAIEVKAGAFVDIYGEPSEEMVLSVVFADSGSLKDGTVLYSLGAEPTTDDMIKAIYSTHKFNEIYGMVELGIGVVATVLEASGLFTIPDPEEMRFQALMLQCERIQIMIADVNAKLDKVSNQIMKLDQKIDQVQMTLLKEQYSKYVTALNNLDNTAALFSKHIKTSMYNDIITGSGDFYIYLVENDKSTHKTDMFSIKHGDYSKETTGAVIGGHKILKTVVLPIGAGTFKLASQTFKYVEGNYNKEGSTANRMIKDLTAYYTANPIEGYTAENLAIGTYKAIIYKLVELAAVKEGGDGDKLINAYKEYVSVTASLHNGVYDPNITNYYHSGIEYVELKYNFYSETKGILQTMNYSAALNTFIYGAVVNVLDQLSVSSDDTLPKYMEEGIKYLKDNTGARDSNAYSYVAHGNLSLGKMKITSTATFKSKDNFVGHVYEKLEGMSHSNTLGNNRYVDTDMIKKINQRWQALGSPESTLAKYINKHTGANLKTFLMTKFEGEGDFSAGDMMYLQTAKDPIMSGKAEYRIMPAKTWLTLANEFSAIKTYSETFDKNIKTKFTYNGEVLNLGNLEPVKVGGKTNCMYAYAAVIDHRWNFVFDEAQYFTSYGYYDDDWFGYAVTGDKLRQYEHETWLNYLRIS